MRKTVFAGALAAMVLAGTQIAVAGDANYTINITGYVPVICHVSTSSTLVDSSGTADLGDMSEFCNNPSGYQVWADYTPGPTSAVITVNGTAIPLSSTGSTMIDSSSTAAIYTRSVSLSGADNLTSISLRIVPI